MLSSGFFEHFGSLWMSMIINPEDYYYFPVAESVSVIRELALSYFDVVTANTCCQCKKYLCAKVRKRHQWSISSRTGRSSSDDWVGAITECSLFRALITCPNLTHNVSLQ